MANMDNQDDDIFIKDYCLNLHPKKTTVQTFKLHKMYNSHVSMTGMLKSLFLFAIE